MFIPIDFLNNFINQIIKKQRRSGQGQLQAHILSCEVGVPTANINSSVPLSCTMLLSDGLRRSTETYNNNNNNIYMRFM